MSDQLGPNRPDPDTEGALAALIRAGQRAREIARQTGTAIVVVRDGELIEEKQPPGNPRLEGSQ